MRLAFGVGGLAGLLAARWPRFAPIATPRVVMPWFLTITVIEVIDNVLGKHPVYRSINGFVIQYMNIQYSEVTGDADRSRGVPVRVAGVRAVETSGAG